MDMTNEKTEKSFLEKARIDKSRAEETISAFDRLDRDEKTKENAMDVLRARAEEEHGRVLGEAHREALLEDLLRKGRISSERIHISLDEAYDEQGKKLEYDSERLAFEGMKYDRLILSSPSETIIQITDEDPSDCSTCRDRLKKIVEAGVFDEQHSERRLIEGNRGRIFLKLESVPASEDIPTFIERVLGWKVKKIK